MRKYIYIILGTVVGLELLTIVRYREQLIEYVKGTMSAVGGELLTWGIGIAILVAILSSFR